MAAGKTSFSHVLGRALLCLALFAAMLGQNFGHLTEEAVAHSSIGLSTASGDPHDSDHSAPCGTPVDCGDYGCHFLAPLRAALAIPPKCHVLATAVPDSSRGAGLSRQDRPPRR